MTQKSLTDKSFVKSNQDQTFIEDSILLVWGKSAKVVLEAEKKANSCDEEKKVILFYNKGISNWFLQTQSTL